MELHIVFVIGAVMFGAVFGSAMNALLYRFPRNISYSKGRSKCPSCKHELGVQDLVPILSWLCLFGRCRYCKTPIGWRYVLLEIVLASAYGIFAWSLGFSWQFGITIFAFTMAVFVLMLRLENKKLKKM